VIEYSSREDMESALKRLDDTKLDGAVVRLFPAKRDDRGGGGRERSPPPARRDRSYSPRRSPRRSRSRDREPDRGRGGDRDRERDRDRDDRSPPPRRRSISPLPARGEPPIAVDRDREEKLNSPIAKVRSPVRERSPVRD
jgi:hypothetical protein